MSETKVEYDPSFQNTPEDEEIIAEMESENSSEAELKKLKETLAYRTDEYNAIKDNPKHAERVQELKEVIDDLNKQIKGIESSM